MGTRVRTKGTKLCITLEVLTPYSFLLQTGTDLELETVIQNLMVDDLAQTMTDQDFRPGDLD